jgi:hypothetical protein
LGSQNCAPRLEVARRQDGSTNIPKRDVTATIRPFDLSEILVFTTSES